MTLPNGSYICVTADNPVPCVICEQVLAELVISNEPVFREGQFLGLEGIVRFESCGHYVWGATADPVIVATMLDKFDLEDDGEDEERRC